MFAALTGRKQSTAQTSASQASTSPSPSLGTHGQPLELVRFNSSTKKFEVGAEALAVLRAVRAPVGVVSVCGRARQGKSFILNQLLGQSNGFVVAPTHRPCTKGLWMWSAPVERVAPDGSKHYLVMLDTEGIDAWDQTGQYSVQIFSLAVLLSSLFVYNQMGGIDEAALDKLSLVTEMTKHIRVRSTPGGGRKEDLGEFSPSFLWLLRDFYLQLEENGRTVTPKDYLETALAAVPSGAGGADAKNEIRDSIKSLFPDRDCFPLLRPMNDEAKLRNLDAVPASELRPEFRKGLSKLMDICFTRAQPKKVGNQVLNGPMLAGLAEAYVDAINKGAVPTIATAWQGVAESECRRAADNAERVYRETFVDTVQSEEGAMITEHQRALSVAQASFDQEAVGAESIKAAHNKKWRDAAQRSFAQVRDRKFAEAKSQVETMINNITLKFQAVTSNPNYSATELSTTLESFLTEYTKSASGPTKWIRLVEFLKSTFLAMVRRAEAEGRSREAAALAKARGSEASLAEARAECAKLRTAAGGETAKVAEMKQHLESAQNKASDSDSQLAEARVECAKLRAAAGSEEAKVLAITRRLEAAHKRREVELSSLRSQLQTASSEVEDRLRADNSRLQQQLQAAELSAASSTSELQVMRARAESMERQLTDVQAARSNAQGEKTGIETALRTALAEKDHINDQMRIATVQSDSLKDELRATLTEKQTLKDQVDDLTRQLGCERTKVNTLEADVAAGIASMKQLELDSIRDEMTMSKRARYDSGGRSSLNDEAVEETNGNGDAVKVDMMTVQEIKEWLTDNGHESDVWELSNRKTPRVKKADWIAAIKAKM